MFGNNGNYNNWEHGTTYQMGTMAMHNNQLYRCIKEHHAHHHHQNPTNEEFWILENQGQYGGGMNNNQQQMYEWRHEQQPATNAGNESDGTPLYAARSNIEGGIHVGKASRSWQDGCRISYGGKELPIAQYEVLVGNPQMICWVHTQGHVNPSALGRQPVEAGRESNGSPLFIARAHFSGSEQPGKCGPGLKGADMAYAGYEENRHEYEVMCMN
ncbi:hypothetical protein BASA50_003315 [Batrachochytrium salamandrivorans]|uniref:Chitin-binding type-3 domain-containing protein n=1 Tax=Batrachochytrium salamandrivorans TaxID=1357716 RepID=A0ABQ8FJ08_9FUNG|nr:hypothetical protein BASA50_003315 [Batrachochytrium salamandrivorans]